MSHPVWVRGLKLIISETNAALYESHPVWVRGLKRSWLCFIVKRYAVAPRVGAWIETLPDGSKKDTIMVAPRVGAWIETYLYVSYIPTALVAPRV